MMVLIPDVLGGWSIYRLAEDYPDSKIAAVISRQLTHVQWAGCSLWDLVMPSFLFAAGMSIAFSRAARTDAAWNRRDEFVRVFLRSAALVLLGMLVQLPVESYADLAWPLVVVALGLPWRRWLLPEHCNDTSARGRRIEFAVWTVVLVSVAAWLATQAHRGFWHFHDILPQLGLAYGFAYLIAGLPRRKQGLVLATILFGYWLLFLLYPLPPGDIDLATVGVQPGDEVFVGLFAHWNKGTNVAAAFDREFLNLLPRAEPFAYNAHGYQTLSFVPVIVSIVFGTIAGEHLRSAKDPRQARSGLLWAGAALVALGWLAGLTVCPIVKSIWTPSWVLFSTGWVLLCFAAFHAVFESSGHASRAAFLIVVGASPLLPYVLGLYYRYWILAPWHKMLDFQNLGPGWSAVADSALVGLSVWTLAYMMYRRRISIRL